MIQSMTGYAIAAADTVHGKLGLELKSVNSRFLDLQFRIVDELRAHEPFLRERLSARIARGKVDCRLYFSSDGAAVAQQALDRGALESLARLAAEARRVVQDAAPLRLADVLRWPGVLGQRALDEEGLRAMVAQLCDRALGELLATRQREGAKLGEAIRQRIAEMRRNVADVAPLVPQALAGYQERLAQRLREALGTGDDERVRTEVAAFGMKIDVDEELTRLRTHMDEVERALDKGGAIGKRLDFLAQELNREANTLASKAASPRITDCALELKLLIEQMREQVQNIE
jgi:uncharacterized protein (TIGR00255 family)